MPPPSFSIPARITASAASSPPSQPSARAASAASRPTSADASAASASRSPLFPLPAGTGCNRRRPRPAAPGGPRRSPRSPPRSARSPPRTACSRYLPAHLVQLRGGQLPGPRPPARRPGPQVPRPVPGMIRLRARAVRLPAAPVSLADAARTEVTGPGQLRIQPARCRSRSSSGSVIRAPLEVLTLPDYRANLELPSLPTICVAHPGVAAVAVVSHAVGVFVVAFRIVRVVPGHAAAGCGQGRVAVPCSRRAVVSWRVMRCGAQGGPAASTAEGCAAPAPGFRGQAFGGAAFVFLLPGVPGLQDALVADDEQAGDGQHEGGQAHEAAPAAADVVAGGVLGGGEAAFGAGAAGVGAAVRG